MRSRIRCTSLLSGLAVVGAVLVAGPTDSSATTGAVLYAAPAATGNQTCTSPANACSLNQAATSATNGDVVELKSGTYSDSGITIEHSITIEAGPLQDPIVDGPATAVAFTVSGSSATTFRGFTISGGEAAISADGTAPVLIDQVDFTGNSTAILADGPTTIDHSTLNGDGVGTQGVLAEAASTGTVTIENSFLTGYQADVAVNGSVENVDISNSTLDEGNYGVIDLQNGGSLSITSSTLTLNSDYGVDVTNTGFTTTFGADVFAGNGASCDLGAEPLTDEGYNISDQSSCDFSAVSSVSGSTSLVENVMGAANNGGPTETRAINHGPSVGLVTGKIGGAAVCGTPDQRGYPRPAAPCDAGAYQSGAPVAKATVAIKASPAASHAGKTVALIATVRGNWSAPDGGYVTFLEGTKSVNATGCTFAPLSATEVATCSATALPAGSNKVSAYFYGDGIYPPTPSPTTTVDITDLTTTKITAPAHGTAGAKITVEATTKRTGTAKLSGTVVFKDNGKKVATVKEKTSGKVTAKITLVKGKNAITATYSGSTTCAASTGKKTVTGKKK